MNYSFSKSSLSYAFAAILALGVSLSSCGRKLMTAKNDPNALTAAEHASSVAEINKSLEALTAEGITLTSQKGAAKPVEIKDLGAVDPKDTIAVNTDALKTALAAKMKDAKNTDEILASALTTAISKATTDFKNFADKHKGTKYVKSKILHGKKPPEADAATNKKMEALLEVLAILTKKDEASESAKEAKDPEKMGLTDLAVKINTDAILKEARTAAAEAP